MEHDIVYYHQKLQSHIHEVERDETDQEAQKAVIETFLTVFDMIKLIMISNQERYYGLFLMNFDLCINFSMYCDAAVSIDAFPFRMSVNPLLIGLRSLPEMIYIFCHEIEHIVLNHPAAAIQYNPQKDPHIAFKLNVAMDASINDRLSADSRERGFSVIAEPENVITSEALREELQLHVKSLQAFDYYYERLLNATGIPGKTTRLVIIGSGNKGRIVTDAKRKGTVCIPVWTVSDDPDEVSGIIHHFIADTCDGMSDEMRNRLSDEQKDTLNRLLEPPALTWERLLKRYVGTIPHGMRKTRMRLNRRQPERYDVSGVISDKIFKVVVAIDTSGSMSVKALEHIMTEIFDIVGTRVCQVTIIECDTCIRRVYQVRSANEVSKEVYGRGGTSFVPVIEYINNNRYFRDAILIYFTDGMGDRSIPRPLTRRTMWVLYNDQCKLSVQNPYGEVLVMD